MQVFALIYGYIEKKTKGREAILRVLSDEHVPVDVSTFRII